LTDLADCSGYNQKSFDSLRSLRTIRLTIRFCTSEILLRVRRDSANLAVCTSCVESRGSRVRICPKKRGPLLIGWRLPK
jgi:hypothetical protein